MYNYAKNQCPNVNNSPAKCEVNCNYHLYPEEKQFIVNMYKQILNEDPDAKTVHIVSKISEVKLENSSLAFNFYVYVKLSINL